MKYWFGYRVLECECGFSTPDEDDFNRHLTMKGHKPKEITEKAPAKKAGAKSAEKATNTKEDHNA